MHELNTFSWCGLCMINSIVAATLWFYIYIQYLIASVNKKNSEFGGNFDVDISLRHGKFRQDGLQQEPFEGVWALPSKILSKWVASVQLTWHILDKVFKACRRLFCISFSAISAWKILGARRMTVNWCCVHSSMQSRCESTCPQRPHLAVTAHVLENSAEFLARLRPCLTQSNIIRARLAAV
jgi:hypothetical protein